jgi:hypothetical protein
VLAVAPRLATPALTRGWALLAALAVASVLLAAVRARSGEEILCRFGVVLPPGERTIWRAEVAAVLAYAEDPAERRRQALGFALALPATAVCCWRLRRASPSRGR